MTRASTPASASSNDVAVLVLRNGLVLLLYLFLLWCSWRLYCLGQYWNNRARAAKARVVGDGGEEGGTELGETGMEEVEVGPVARASVQAPKGSYGTPYEPMPPPLAMGKKESARVGLAARLGLRARKLLSCCCPFSFSSSSRWSGRFTCAMPEIPPVLFLLLTGVAARELLEYINYNQSVRQLRGRMAKGVEAAAQSGANADMVGNLLSISKPFLLFGLATIGLDIGSHLAYPQLSLVKRQLCLFLLVLFPLVFAGMTLVFRLAGARLLQSDARMDWLLASLRVVTDAGGGNGPHAGKPISSSLPGSSTARRGGGGVVRVAADESPSAMVDSVVGAFSRYEDAALWCFALVMASITVERSSPEFINAIHNTGARGVLPTFILCITACQDIAALLFFVLVSSVIRPVQVDGARQLLTQVGSLVTSALGGGVGIPSHGGRSGAGANGTRTTRPEPATGEVEEDGEQSAAKELLLIATATVGAAVVSLLLRKAWLLVLRRVEERAGRKAGEGRATVESAEVPGPVLGEKARPVVYASFGLLALLTTNLSLWSAATPCELLLAAVITGSGANFFTPCPLLHLSVGAMNEVTNVVLFTSMGIRTRFSSYTVPTMAELQAQESPPKQWRGSGGGVSSSPLPRAVSPPSFLAVLAWGVAFFACRTALLWLGGFLGATVAAVERLVNRYTTPPSGQETPAPPAVANDADNRHKDSPAPPPLGTAAASTLKKRDEGKEAKTAVDSASPVPGSGTPVKPITGVRNWIGLALVTQLAIALTLNARGSEEYDKRMSSVLSRDYFSTSKGAEKGRTVSLVLESLRAEHIVPSMAPLVQAYTISIALAMISGPVLGAWVLRKGTTARK